MTLRDSNRNKLLKTVTDWSDPEQVRAYKRWWNANRRDKEKQSAYYKRWRELNKEVNDGLRTYDPKSVRRWYAANPLARKAHKAVQEAIFYGKLVKGDHCEKCGATGKRVVAHHEDYTKPLEIVWMCDLCHKRMHVERRVYQVHSRV